MPYILSETHLIVDVEFAEADLNDRSVRWIPFKVTRDSLLNLLYLDGLCWWVTDECTDVQSVAKWASGTT